MMDHEGLILRSHLIEIIDAFSCLLLISAFLFQRKAPRSLVYMSSNTINVQSLSDSLGKVTRIRQYF